ncbi:hypothetical protein BJ959_000481 [Chryseoglobus frigidaquae]|uniref:Uncharacterized protein n=1 Tax=Microcella frigidaquae TaxID=424758 RepID=A0A840X754_9MICO|nr:hypothetical protein [Microcella frigidaquae]
MHPPGGPPAPGGLYPLANVENIADIEDHDQRGR